MTDLFLLLIGKDNITNMQFNYSYPQFVTTCGQYGNEWNDAGRSEYHYLLSTFSGDSMNVLVAVGSGFDPDSGVPFLFRFYF